MRPPIRHTPARPTTNANALFPDRPRNPPAQTAIPQGNPRGNPPGFRPLRAKWGGVVRPPEPRRAMNSVGPVTSRADSGSGHRRSPGLSDPILGIQPTSSNAGRGDSRPADPARGQAIGRFDPQLARERGPRWADPARGRTGNGLFHVAIYDHNRQTSGFVTISLPLSGYSKHSLVASGYKAATAVATRFQARITPLQHYTTHSFSIIYRRRRIGIGMDRSHL
jgi:hypothetical protein